MPWRWGPPNRGIRASVSYASPPYSGRRVFVAFIDTASPALANLVVPLFLIAPPYQSSRWGDFFLPPHHHVMPVPACLPRRRMSLSSARAGVLRSFFFVGFIWDRLLARSAVSHPPCPYTARLLVMPSFQSPRPSTRRAGRAARFPFGAFHVRTPWYNSPSLFIQSLIALPA